MAAAGHYYSFIKVRTTPETVESGSAGKWFLFNDSEVTETQLTDAFMEHEFFGGKYTPDEEDVMVGGSWWQAVGGHRNTATITSYSLGCALLCLPSLIPLANPVPRPSPSLTPTLTYSFGLGHGSLTSVAVLPSPPPRRQSSERERHWNAYLVFYERRDVTEALAAGRRPATLVKSRTVSEGSASPVPGAGGGDGSSGMLAAVVEKDQKDQEKERVREKEKERHSGGQRPRSGSASSDSSTASSASLVTRMNQLLVSGNSSAVFHGRMPESILTAVREDNIQFAHQR